MKSTKALRVLAEVAAHQWGMVTSAQVGMHGITRLDLSRLANDGHLKRLAHGVYKDSGVPGDQFEDLHAAWLSTEPKAMGESRLQNRANGVVVAGTSAARLHDIGDLWANRHEFVSPKRRQSQRAEIRYRQRTLDPHDITLVQGLPTMTVERTIADLAEEVGDLSLVADALRDAALERNPDLNRLRELLAPLAERNGFRRRDGNALLNRLLETAGIDANTVARRVAADSALGSRVTANYLGNLKKADMDQLFMAPEMQKSMHAIQGPVAEILEATLAPQIAGLNANTEVPIAKRMKNRVFDDVARQLAAKLTSSDVIKHLAEDWGKSLSASIALKPETLAALRAAQDGGRQ